MHLAHSFSCIYFAQSLILMESFFHRDQLSQSCLGWKWAGNGNLETQIARRKILIKWFIQSCKWMFISCNVHSTVGTAPSLKGGQDINWYIHTHSCWEVQAECSRRSKKTGVTSDYGNQEGRLELVRQKVRERVFQVKGGNAHCLGGKEVTQSLREEK